ncbi:MAG TPA: hypothetical protein VJ835_10500 [Fimbriimonadaceae bacterium]|nr:hypothetical protein [Fimbriimonadaceae bacterium]
MKIDWQAFRDGSLPEQEMALAREELRTNPEATRSLESLDQFIEAVRQEALREEVPLSRLESLIPSTKPETRRLSWYWLPAGAAVAAALALFLVNFPSETSKGALETNDPVVATNWVKEQQSFDLPTMDLGSDVPIVRVHEGGDICCFDYQVKGKTYHLNVGKNPSIQMIGDRKMLPNGREVYVGRGVRWLQAGYDLRIEGPDKQVLLDLANRASTVLEKA